MLTAAAAVAALTMSGCTNYTKMLEERPAEYISMAQENTAKAMAGNIFGEEYKLLQEACEDGSLKLDFEIEGVQFSGELYVNEKDEKSAQMYRVTGTEGTSAEVYLYTGKDGLKIGTNGISGRHVYDVTFEGLTEKLAASIFAPDSGTEYAMEQEEYDAVVQYIDEMSAAMEGDGSESADKLLAVIDDFKEAHPPVTEEKADADIGGETVSANIVTYSYSKEDIASLTEQFVDLYLNEYADEKDFEYYSKDEQKEQIMSLFNEMDSCDLKIVHYVNSKSHMLMMTDIDLLASADGENMYFYADVIYGADPENSNKQSFKAGVGEDGEEEDAVEADITTNENGSEIVFSVTVNGEEKELATLVSTKDGENYTITLDIPSAEISCKAEGTVKTDKKSFEITLDRVSAVSGSAEVSYLPKGVLTVEKGGTMPELDAEKEFLDITEEEMDTLYNNIVDDINAVLKETPYSDELLEHIEESRQASANSNAKAYHTAVASMLTMSSIEGTEFAGDEFSGSGMAVSIGGEEFDISDYFYVGDEGYVYGEFDPVMYSVNYILWSKKPIPDELKHQLSSEDMQKLADEGVYIGQCSGSFGTESGGYDQD